MLQLSRLDARRAAIRAQLLTATRPADIVEAVDGLNVVAIDPTAAIAPNADLVLWGRIGWPYTPADLTRVFEQDRAVFEWGGFYRSMADLPALVPEMRAAPRHPKTRQWLEVNDRFRADVLARLRGDGPLHASRIPDTAQVSWASSGWTNSRNSMQMLEVLLSCGEIAVHGRDAKGRLFDLAERVYPLELPELDPADAARERRERRLGALGVARAKGIAQPGEPVDVGAVGVAAVIEGTSGQWRVDPEALETAFAPRAALLSPLDRLVFDRDRLRELFGFEYVLEMYKPAAQRRWGYFALPILYGDRFVGKLDAKADRKAGMLRVFAVHEDEPFTHDVRDAVHGEIHALAQWLGMQVEGLDAR